jgi:hypothetical protein
VATDITTKFRRAARSAVSPSQGAAAGRRARILYGTALRFNDPRPVHDAAGHHYIEEWAPTSVARSLAERHWWPLNEHHRPRRPVGFVEFIQTPTRLLFLATLDRSPAADQLWRLQQLGQWQAVSIDGYDFAPSKRLDDARVPIIRRGDVTIDHLAIVPNDQAQLPYARVELIGTSEPTASTLTLWRLLDLQRA